jgi:hypothetical protein
LKRPVVGALAFVAALAALATAGGPARAEDYVIVRGAYYREASTRVIQPMVELQRDSDNGLDVGAHFLVDAITSASIAAGTATDAVFTETRNEAGLSVGKRWSRFALRGGYRYSAESDYWSHSVGMSGVGRLWGDTATVRLSLGRSFDSMTARGRPPDCRVLPSNSCELDVWFGSVAYTQVLSPVLIAQASYDLAYLDGFQGNVYRAVPGIGFEVLPYRAGGSLRDGRRLRHAISPRIAYYVPRTGTGFQLAYRYYWDQFPGTPAAPGEPWDLRAHTIEGRVYQEVGPYLEVRLLYRHYIQDRGAAFWCDTAASPGCYPPGSVFYSSDPKLGPVHTQYPEVKLVISAAPLADTPVLRWFSTGSFEISYGYYMQDTAYGDAHLLQSGYRMPY